MDTWIKPISEVSVEQLFNYLFSVGCFAAVTLILMTAVLLGMKHQYKLTQYQKKANLTFRERRRSR